MPRWLLWSLQRPATRQRRLGATCFIVTARVAPFFGRVHLQFLCHAALAFDDGRAVGRGAAAAADGGPGRAPWIQGELEKHLRLQEARTDIAALQEQLSVSEGEKVEQPIHLVHGHRSASRPLWEWREVARKLVDRMVLVCFGRVMYARNREAAIPHVECLARLEVCIRSCGSNS